MAPSTTRSVSASGSKFERFFFGRESAKGWLIDSDSAGARSHNVHTLGPLATRLVTCIAPSSRTTVIVFSSPGDVLHSLSDL